MPIRVQQRKKHPDYNAILPRCNGITISDTLLIESVLAFKSEQLAFLQWHGKYSQIHRADNQRFRYTCCTALFKLIFKFRVEVKLKWFVFCLLPHLRSKWFLMQMYIKSARFYTGKIKKRFFFRGKIAFLLDIIQCLSLEIP